MFKGNLRDVLTKIAEQLSLDPAQLIQFSQQAPHAETRPDGNPWPSGTGSVSEKRILYAIARAKNPILSLDIGTRWGAMALQIIEGSIDAPPPSGRVISVDNEKFIYGTKHKVGKFIPKNLGSEFATSDAVVFLKQTTLFYDLIFEDTMHTVEMTKAIYDVAVDHLIAGGIIISHDAVHPKFKGAVVAGIRQSGIEPEVYLVEGDSCGLAIWQKPKTQLDIVYQTGKALPDESIIGDSTPTILNQNIPDETEATPEVPKKAPKRRRRKKASKSVKDMYPSGVPETIDKGISEGIERIKTAIEEV